MTELRFEDVTIAFGNGRHRMKAADRVNLVVPRGSCLGLVGESGSGKSSLARAAAGLYPVTDGRILLDGKPITKATTRDSIRMVFQDPYASLDPRLTVGASLAAAIPRHLVRSKRDRMAEVSRLLNLVELGDERIHSLPSELSGGQRQRIALARALAANPKVVIADEITSALDVSIQGTVLNLVRDLQDRLGFSMLFISHNLAAVHYVSDRIAVMYLGQIVENEAASEVLNSPKHPYTKDLLEAALNPVESHAGTANLLDLEPADPHDPPSGCRFNPRCAEGPLVNAERTNCRTFEPVADGHAHLARCHYAELDVSLSSPSGLLENGLK